MSTRSRRKGSDGEIKLLAWLHANGHPEPEAVRNPSAGSKDVGDLTVWNWPTGERIVVEVKNWEDQTAAINQGLKELDAEMVNAGASHGVLVVKRRGKGDPGEWLAVRKVRNDPEIGAL